MYSLINFIDRNERSIPQPNLTIESCLLSEQANDIFLSKNFKFKKKKKKIYLRIDGPTQTNFGLKGSIDRSYINVLF